MSEELLHVHNPGKDTEHLAFEKVEPHLKKMKRSIYLAVLSSGENGLIPDEYPGLINTVRRRFTDLWKEGMIRPTERTRANSNGNQCSIWITGSDPLVKKTESNIEKIKRLEERVAFLEGENARLGGLGI